MTVSNTRDQTNRDVLGTRVGIFADVHGATRLLSRALGECERDGVETIVLLGDLFDRHEQADRCARVLAGWNVVGVYGNHEREVALGAVAGEYELREETIQLLSVLQEDIVLDDARLAHEVEHWDLHDPVGRMFSRSGAASDQVAGPRVTFTGHTHFRLARDDRGALDISRGRLTLEPQRRYLINPGALLIGQFATWDRIDNVVYFRHVDGM